MSEMTLTVQGEIEAEQLEKIGKEGWTLVKGFRGRDYTGDADDYYTFVFEKSV